MVLCKAFVVVVAVGVGYLLGTSPASVTPPLVPDGSPVAAVPPWPLFRFATALNGLLVAAAEATTPPDVRALDLSTAFWKTEVTYALVHSGIIDAIPPDGSATASALATQLGLAEPFLARYLNAGAKLGVLSRSAASATAEPAYALTPTGATMRADGPVSLRDFVLMIAAPYVQAAWKQAGERSIASGRSGFVEAHGEECWDYWQGHAEESATFDRAMTSLTAMVATALIADWEPPAALGGPNATVCDVGGGRGTLLAHWLEHHPHARGIVFDQPHVVPSARAFLAERGVAERALAVGGSFFEPLPAKLRDECDVFLLKHILHDWPDEECVAILTSVRAGAKPGAVVANVDSVLDIGAPAPMELTKALHDINMLANCHAGARERTMAQFASVYAKAGLPAPALVPLRNLFSLVVATVPH